VTGRKAQRDTNTGDDAMPPSFFQILIVIAPDFSASDIPRKWSVWIPSAGCIGTRKKELKNKE
jgi:hypothetical protein